MKVERIMVPVDGSELAEEVLPLVTPLAARAGAALRLVHVRDPLRPIYVDGLPVVDESLNPLPELHERTYLHRLRSRVEEREGPEIEAVILDGPVARTLAHHAQQANCGLIVMTTHGFGGVQRLWLGSVADRLVRLSEVPLLLHKPQPESQAVAGSRWQLSLVPLDGSADAEKILDHVTWLAKMMGGRVRLMQVVSPASTAEDADPDLITGPEAKRYLRDVAERLAAQGIEVDTYIESHEEPATAILAHARESGADLVAMTTRGRGAVQRMFLGSVSDKVLRSIEVPLLLFRPQG